MLTFLNNLLRLLLKKRIINTGSPRDDRTDLQIKHAYDARELYAGSTPLLWEEKTQWRTFPVKRQWYTFECVAQSTTKHLSINNLIETGNYIELCARFFYWFRNRLHSGMGFNDATRIATTIGACRNERIKQRIRETDPETAPTQEMIDEAIQFAGKDFWEDKERTMDSIARIVQERGSCLIWIYFDVDGKEYWKIEPKPIYNFKSPYDNGTTRHGVIITDFGLKNGKKVLVDNDSADNDSALDGQVRFLDEQFISKRCFISWFVIDKPNTIPEIKKPKWKGTRNLAVGDTGDDVANLQEILQYEGCFDYPKITNYFGGYTGRGVKKLQEKHAKEILKPLGLTKGTYYCWNSTRKWLEKNYA